MSCIGGVDHSKPNPFGVDPLQGAQVSQAGNYTPIGIEGDYPQLSKREAIMLSKVAGKHKATTRGLDRIQMREMFPGLARESNNLSGNMMVDLAQDRMLRSLSQMQIDSLTIVVVDGTATVIDTAVGGVVLAPFETVSGIANTLMVGGEMAKQLPIVPGFESISVGCSRSGCAAAISTFNR